MVGRETKIEKAKENKHKAHSVIGISHIMP